MAEKIFVNKGERAFSPFVVRSLDKWAADRGGKHVVDCAWFGRDGEWTYGPVSIYYAPVRPDGSRFTNSYFGLSASGAVFDADKIEQILFAGMVAKGEFIFSRWRHDFRSFSFGGPSVDGGLDYLRIAGRMEGCRIASFSVRNGEFVENT